MALASSEAAMDDTFRVRVEKIFGSLSSSSSSSSSSSTGQPSSTQSALWSLSDEKVERREWRRNTAVDFDRDQIPCASSFDHLENARRKLEDDLDDLDGEQDPGDCDELSRSRRGGGGHDGVDEWEIRSSIGLDCTLDYEEEEDEYDKVASGRENAGERLYMRHASDQGSCLNLHDGPTNLLHGIRDRRANYLAAKVRLQEDEAEAQKLNSVHDGDVNVNQLHLKAVDELVPLRSILKRKDNSSDVKPCKRVRFDPSCAAAHQEEASEKIQGISMGTTSFRESMSGQNASGLLDYLQNPSKYTHYSFGLSCEVDDTSNTQAFMDFLKLMKNSQCLESASQLEDAAAVLPKSVPFIPKKKPGKAEVMNHSSEFKQEKGHDVDQSLHQRGFPVGIAARESQESEVDKVEDDESEPNVAEKGANSPKHGRRYRIKSSSDDVEA